MDFAAQLFDSLSSEASRLGRRLTRDEWLGVVRAEWAKVGASNPMGLQSPRKKRSVSSMTDEEWVASLEQEPSLKGINIKQEIGRAQFWCKNNKRIPTCL